MESDKFDLFADENCRFGSTCRYEHIQKSALSDAEKRQMERSLSRERPVSTKVCHQWILGKCRFGEQCRYRHDAELVNSAKECSQKGENVVCVVVLAAPRLGKSLSFVTEHETVEVEISLENMLKPHVQKGKR